MTEQRGPAPVVVDLGPNRQQLVHAFMWAVLGIVAGLIFVVLAVRGGDVQSSSVAIGVGIMLLGSISGVLEYLALPGAVVRVNAEQLVIEPRRGDAVVIPLESLGRLELESPEVAHERRLFGELAGELVIPGRQPRNFAEAGIRGRRPAPTWRLTAHPRPGGLELPGHGLAIAVGIDDAKKAALRTACSQFDLLFSTTE